MSSPRILLASMPFVGLSRPPAGIGVLHAILEQQGFTVSSRYAYLEFAEQIGLERWSRIASTSMNDGLADFIFTPAAFPEHEISIESFVSLLFRRKTAYSSQYSQETLHRLIRDTQQDGSRFITSLAQSILEYEPDVVGCSSTFLQNVASLALFREIKKVRPQVATLLGGANCEGVMGLTLFNAFPWLDGVVSGEADTIIADVMKDLVDAGHRSAGLEGVYLRHHVPQKRDASRQLPTMDTLPLPNYSEYFQTLHRCSSLSGSVRETITIETSRGCWWNKCDFCGLNGCSTPYRSRSATNALETIIQMSRSYKRHRIGVVDNILDMRYFKTLIPELRRLKKTSAQPLSIFYETKSNLSEEQVVALAEAGIRWIQPGIESLHSDILKLMHKGCRAWENIRLLKYAYEQGVRMQWFIMNGFPGEKEQWYGEMADLLPALHHLQAPVNIVPVVFTRFSGYHRDPDRYGLSLQPAEPFARVYPTLSDAELNAIVYFFDAPAFDEERCKQLQPSSLLENCFRRLRFEIAEWMMASEKKPPLLRFATRGQEDAHPAYILDTRKLSGAGAARYPLSEMAWNILQECRHGIPDDEKPAWFADDTLRELVEKRYILRIDGMLLTVVTFAQKLPFLSREEFPGGITLSSSGPLLT